jgi:hypothetical protein
LDATYIVFVVWIGQDQIDCHEENNKARHALFSVLALPEFELVRNLETAREIWSTLERYHEGTSHVKTTL